MKEQSGYIPPRYIPLEQSDLETEILPSTDKAPIQNERVSDNDAPVPVQWSSGICACFDDLQSCIIGMICPCLIFGKNAEFLGSGTFMGSCATHFIMWGLINPCCCMMTAGLLLGFPGCFVSCYACGYRKALRTKYNLQEAPCGDFITHLFCHLCALCQEYREIHERSADSNPSTNVVAVIPPPVQSMD